MQKTIEKIRSSKNKEIFLYPSHKRKFFSSINACNLRWPLLFFPGMAKVSCGIYWHDPWTNSGISSDIKIIVTELYMLYCWNFSHRDLEYLQQLTMQSESERWSLAKAERSVCGYSPSCQYIYLWSNIVCKMINHRNSN